MTASELAAIVLRQVDDLRRMRDRLEVVRQQRNSYRRLAQAAIHYGRQLTLERNRVRRRLDDVLDAARRERA